MRMVLKKRSVTSPDVILQSANFLSGVLRVLEETKKLYRNHTKAYRLCTINISKCVSSIANLRIMGVVAVFCSFATIVCSHLQLFFGVLKNSSEFNNIFHTSK